MDSWLGQSLLPREWKQLNEQKEKKGKERK
jgi:hypothetical protein